jgi:amino acid adenylation domain-containing protein
MNTAVIEHDKMLRILADWNESAADYPDDKPMHRLFEALVDKNPTAVALIHGERRLTYAELNRSANQIARHLRTLGVGPDVLVGISMHRCVEMVVGLLAVLKAGGAYVPLDPAYPQSRLAGMMNDIDIKVLLTMGDLAGEIPHCAAHVVHMDEAISECAALDAENLVATASGDNLCYVIFTSGSTGKPKAAAVFHRGWVNLVSWFIREFAIDASDNILVISSFSFDITQRSIIMPLISGGQLHLFTSNLYDPARILRTISEQQVTRLNCAPSTFYPLVEAPTQTTFDYLRSLKTVFLGGEPISASRLRAWAEGSDTEVANVYGVAECSDVSSFYRLKDYDRYVRTSVPVGKPVANSKIYLLDEALAAVPIGVAGEICIGGVGVGKGYINDAALTAAKFVPDPYSNAPRARLYRTGDLARLGSDWNLEFIGRADHQVKIRGFRVHLGDIEVSLRQCSGVRDAVVLKKEFAPGDERLVAYVVPTEHAPAAFADEIRASLKELLPEYMVPAAIVTLQQLPLNPNGKIDREALLRIENASDSPRSGPDSPRGKIEQDVAAIFAASLKLEDIGIDDDFFDLGGDSLTAVFVVANVADRLGMSVPIETLFETRTLRKFCHVIQGMQH